MPDELAKLLETLHPQPRQHRDHTFPAQFRAKIMVVVIARLDPHRIIETSDAAPGGHGGLAIAFRFGKKLRDGNLQALAHLEQLVVSESEAVVLDLGQGREWNSATSAHFLKRPSFSNPK